MRGQPRFRPPRLDIRDARFPPCFKPLFLVIRPLFLGRLYAPFGGYPTPGYRTSTLVQRYYISIPHLFTSFPQRHPSHYLHVTQGTQCAPRYAISASHPCFRGNYSFIVQQTLFFVRVIPRPLLLEQLSQVRNLTIFSQGHTVLRSL